MLNFFESRSRMTQSRPRISSLSPRASVSTHRTFRGAAGDPCRLVQQVKEIDLLDAAPQKSAQDPWRLVRQVNEILQLEPGKSDSPAGRAGRVDDPPQKRAAASGIVS